VVNEPLSWHKFLGHTFRENYIRIADSPRNWHGL
jgi:hypothetical protein